jgi:SAM-dependent methyltransferase
MSQGPNQQQIDYWNQVAGPRWAEMGDRIHDQIAPIGEAAMQRAQVAPGERVLDVGCGCGHTSLELARRAGPGGRVQGIDISGPMLASARDRASGAGVGNISFLQADAQVHDFEAGSFDLLFSRFGVMFFEDPVAAFANLRRALADAGRLCFVCWQAIQHNPWMLTPAAAAAQHVELSPPEPGAPGPFAFADADRVRGILADAGYREIGCQDQSGELAVGRGRSLEETIEFLSQMGPAGAALREASEETRAKARSSMRDALAPFYTGDALVMRYAAWIVTARP